MSLGRKHLSAIGTLVIMVAMSPVSAVITTNDPSLPPLEPSGYLTADDVHNQYGNDPTVLEILLERAIHKAILVEIRQRTQKGEEEFFESVLEVDNVRVNGADTGPATLNGPVHTIVFGKDPADDTGFWETEMVSMQLSGNVGGNNVLIRESPSLPSEGQTTVTDIGGGQFQIESFFDVFTELSLDNGQTWVPSNGAARVTLMPEPGSLALIGMGVVTLLRRWRPAA